MNVIVLVKQVPDTEARIKVKPGELDIDREGLNYVLNPYDEFAVEEALRIKEKSGGEVVVVCLGEKRMEEAIRTALAMGADRAIRIDGDEFKGADQYSTAAALAKAVGSVQFDVILCGKQAVDDDSAQVGQTVAEFLNVPHVSVITKLEIAADGRSAKVTREIEGGAEIDEVPLPALFTAQKGLNEPRYPSLPGIMKAKKKELKVVGASDLGLDAASVGAAGAKTKTTQLLPPPERQAGKLLEGEPDDLARQLARLLREEAKLI
ncbi:MAG: electron transfer flavoprotein subunit beta/FixA family protein [bacterium]